MECVISLSWCTQLRDYTKEKTGQRTVPDWDSPVGTIWSTALLKAYFCPEEVSLQAWDIQTMIFNRDSEASVEEFKAEYYLVLCLC